MLKIGLNTYRPTLKCFVSRIKPTESIDDETIKNEAIDFLSQKNRLRSFHQTLRHEILFALAPQTFESSIIQRAELRETARLLTKKGFLHDQGLNQLGTIQEFCKIIKQNVFFEYEFSKLEDFCDKG